MKVAIKQTDVLLWHYTCRECGFGNAETGYHAPLHMIYCEVCLEDGRQVKLQRWPVDHDSSPAPSGRLSRR
jgi:late competence protein required for DNA uptake (superfamily II DNA/RNA helicase)